MFPTYLRSAVRKYGDTAAISITFTSNLSNCLISLAILPNKVQHLALVLFDIILETDNRLRYIIQANGSRLFPRPELALVGA
ncbi:hypothetical protein CC78DRAFT_474671 [Lojkania enalia]|uniref:Uncharacterized protein n=1 Tax=Lojkania enalia TaxID=147567 RepID=A0A9P4MZQ0_9PLEO|nr:hypothetical protein CC78DRAFT_474671 [Didymosphaeria enalia]